MEPKPPGAKRRAKGPPALGDINVTKVVAEAMIDKEAEDRRSKTERLRALRLAQQANLASELIDQSEEQGVGQGETSALRPDQNLAT